MSSPGTFPQWQTPQPQGPPANNDANEDGVSIRPMRLKVLYTFDDQNKTNCLARGNDVLQIKTVAMDDTTTIGVIELKTCIELVVQSSPELIARLGQDYTIYAYDYSEYDTPLVGQGMLSRALASSSPNPDAPAQQNQKLITGRVCKNILGLFNNGVKETLEVKLRLVSVPTAVQSEYANQMEKYREMTRTAGFEPNEWAAFLQSNPGLGQMAGNPRGPSSRSGSINMEVVNQLLSPSLSQSQIDPFNQTNAEMSGNESRGAASGEKAKNSSRPSSRASVKRPRKPRQPKATAVGGNTSGYEEGTDVDDGPAPKRRAKITKTDWNSKSSFGTASDSLRVTASTAGSLRMFRPIAMAVNTPGHMQELPRAPTPVPDMPQNSARGRVRSQSALRRDSTVSHTDTPRNGLSPFPNLGPPGGPEDELRYSIESVGPSPERQSPAETPPDIGSSPPVMRTVSPLRSSPPCPSSPILPQMRRNETDSGFMSGTLDDLFREDDEMQQPIAAQDSETASKYNKRIHPTNEEAHHCFEIQQENPGPVELLPTRMPVHQPPPKSKSAVKPPKSRAGSVMSEDGQQTLPHLKNGSRQSSRRPTTELPPIEGQMVSAPHESQTPADAQFGGFVEPGTSLPENNLQQHPIYSQPSQVDPCPAPSTTSESRPASRTMVRTASMGSLTLPTIPQSDPTLPPSILQRSQTWSETPHPQGQTFYMPMYPVPDQAVIAAELSRAQALEAKKAAMKQKLENAIAQGVMPPFCSNCGAIETPTWRKAWSQDVQGAPPYFEYSDEPGRVTTIVILERDEQGYPTSYQLIKKFLLAEEKQEEFKEVILCNPCGIWMSKYKSHRPEEKWECNRNKKGPEKKRNSQRPAKPKKLKNTGNMNPTSEANYPQSDYYYPQSEAYQQSEAAGPPEEVTQVQQQTERQRSASTHPAKRLNAMTSDAASAALKRAIQSSPARWAGTAVSPIDVEEDDLGSTRRLLFPSPRKDGSPKVLGEVATNVVTIATDFHSPKQAMEALNKENCPPALDDNDCDTDILRLFEEEMARPMTPVRESFTQNPFKTPTRQTPSHRPITRSVTRSIHSTKSPGQLLLFQKTPSETPSNLTRRRSPRNHDFESPFTATLNQIMSDANERHSPSRGMQFDFPDSPAMTDARQHGQGNYSLEDFFSTDVPMPSSPPRTSFHLYEDPLTMSNMDWNEFSDFDTSMLDNDVKTVEIKKEAGTGEEPQDSTQQTDGS